MRLLAILLFALFAFPALAQQETPQEERSYFIAFVEDQLSGPNRQIRIEGIQGVLSSNATFGSITVADNEGVWLRITNAAIVWSRSTLLFSQRLQIDRLAAERIEVIRRPIPDESLPAPESSSFRIPELPIAVNLDELAVERVSFGASVFGLESEVAATGRINLADGSLDTALEIERLDGPGGRLALAATYADETEQLDLELSLTEPENGVVANLLNIEGRPPVDLSIAGSGPLDGLDVTLALDIEGQRALEGVTSLRGAAEGLRFATDLSGSIARLVPPQFRDFFGAETRLQARGITREAGGLELETLQLESAALRLEASAETGADGFLRRLGLNATIDDGTGEPILLPLPGGRTSVERAEVDLFFGEAANEAWSGEITIENLATDDFTASRAAIDLGGLARDLDNPASRSITFAVDGALTGIVATRDDVAEALGDSITLDIDGDWNAGAPVRVANATIAGNGFSASLVGDVADLALTGEYVVAAQSLAPFSGLAGRPLQGALDLKASGTVRPVGGGFDLAIDSTAEELAIGTEAVDNLLSGTTTITGRLGRGEEGIVAERLRIGNAQLELNADGRFATGTADFDYSAILTDLALLSTQASGRLEARGRAVGSEGLITLTTLARVPSGSLAGRRLSEGQLAFEGTLEDGALNGMVGGDAFLDGVRAQLSAGIALDDDGRRLTDLDFTAGGARLRGAVAQGNDGLLTGDLALDAADISTAAALFLVEAAGAVEATIALQPVEGRQQATASADLRSIRFGQAQVGSATLQARVEDLFGVPVVDGEVRASDVVAGGIDVTTLNATARSSDGVTAFGADATLANGAEAATRGTLEPEAGGYRVTLDEASLGRGLVAARLVEPASLLVVGDAFTIDALTLDVGGGRVSATGSIARELDLDITIAQLPLSIANLVRPDLALGGTIDGRAAISGTRDAPQASFDVTGADLTAAALRQIGQRSLDVTARGETNGQRLTVDASVTSPDGLRASASGAVPLGQGQIALDVQLQSFPLAALDAVAPGQGLGGTITGTASVGGELAAPQATFDLRGASISAAPLREAGIASLDASAAGRFAGQTVTLSRVDVGGPQGLALEASGTVPLSGSGLSVNVSGSAPLALANRFLADRGTQLAGTLQLSGSVSGSLSQPAVRGMVSTQGAQLVDPESNVRLGDINIMASMEGDTIVIRSASAALGTGGSLSASGTISANAAAGFPADIRINLAEARYADGNLVVATVSGNLAVTGALARDPLISGDIAVERAEITVPENLGGGAASIDVVHRNAPGPVRATLERARANDGTPTPTSRPSVVRLDVSVSAPARIFVRGRGLDAELGGQVRLVGPITDIQPVGGFNLIRGRLAILGQRITFDEGTVTLVGDLDPFINFVARSGGSDIVVIITISGRVSAPDITFSSQPELPEDEVLARLIFKRGIGELSPFQIAQLALAAAELAGGSNTSLLGSLRQATGLDDIDVVTDSEGNTAVRAGRYIQDNVYLGVEAGSEGTTRGTINLDITEELRARGAVGSDGDSSIGIFYERDY